MKLFFWNLSSLRNATNVIRLKYHSAITGRRAKVVLQEWNTIAFGWIIALVSITRSTFYYLCGTSFLQDPMPLLWYLGNYTIAQVIITMEPAKSTNQPWYLFLEFSVCFYPFYSLSSTLSCFLIKYITFMRM